MIEIRDRKRFRSLTLLVCMFASVTGVAQVERKVQLKKVSSIDASGNQDASRGTDRDSVIGILYECNDKGKWSPNTFLVSATPSTVAVGDYVGYTIGIANLCDAVAYVPLETNADKVTKHAHTYQVFEIELEPHSDRLCGAAPTRLYGSTEIAGSIQALRKGEYVEIRATGRIAECKQSYVSSPPLRASQEVTFWANVRHQSVTVDSAGAAVSAGWYPSFRIPNEIRLNVLAPGRK